MFDKIKTKSWKCEYDETVYKIYDWDNRLTGYYYPKYNIDKNQEEIEDDIIFKMNKNKDIVMGGHIMLPMVRLDLLDAEYIGLEQTISNLETSLNRVREWSNWIANNKTRFHIINNFICTSREDRNMLAILLDINQKTTLDEKEILTVIKPLLNQLNMDGLV
ncbi:MAG: hypothetical protein R3321_05460 [Nitrososphaeraceae archaeon]|nr:hypothetical protein [Nitrososphaeraceae archaeon]